MNNLLVTGENKKSRTPRMGSYNIGVQPVKMYQQGKTQQPNEHHNYSRYKKNWREGPLNCYMCGKLNSDHFPSKCPKFKHGTEVRDRLTQLNRCVACTQLASHHEPRCNPKGWMKCHHHPKERHFQQTCDGTEHPGGMEVARR